jgi:hypothetical protein
LGAAADAAFDQAEAAGDAAYTAVEDIADEILAAKATSVTDLAIKARVLAWHGCVEDVGYYRPEEVLGFFAEVQTFRRVVTTTAAVSAAALSEASAPAEQYRRRIDDCIRCRN